MKIRINPIPHSEQRYSTCGDWQIEPAQDSGKEDLLKIKVSQLSDWRREFLVGIHELIEAALCKQAGVTQEMVDEFDMNFEANRKDGDKSEPGDHAAAPYYHQHQIATGIERMLATSLHVHWGEYERELDALP